MTDHSKPIKTQNHRSDGKNLLNMRCMIISNQTGIAALKTHFVQCKCSNQRVEGGGTNSKVSTFRVQKKNYLASRSGFSLAQLLAFTKSFAYLVSRLRSWFVFSPRETNKPTMRLTSDANDFVNANAMQEKTSAPRVRKTSSSPVSELSR